MKIILVLLLVGFAVGKPSVDFEEEFIRDLFKDDDSSYDATAFPSQGPVPSARPSVRPSGGSSVRPSARPSVRPSGGSSVRSSARPSVRPSGGSSVRPSVRPSGGPSGKPDEKDIPLFYKFAHFLLNLSVGKVEPDEHPDLKYRKPGEKLVQKLLGVRRAVIEVLKPLHEIAKLMIQDHIEMMRRVKNAVDNDDIHQAKHVVGEYFIALNRRFFTFFIHAEQAGLFEKIDDDKDNEDMKNVRRELRQAADEAGEKARNAAEFILKNFNQFRVSDGLPDRPFIKLGVETALVLARTFKQMEKVSKISMKVYIDMVSDIVRLALKEKNHEGAIQRAGAGVLSMVRRQTKIGIALHRIYNTKKCFGAGPDEEIEEPGQKGREEKQEIEKEFEEEEQDSF